MTMDHLTLIGVALAGTLLSSFLSCIPALHIYNVAGFLVVLAVRFEGVVAGEVLATVFEFGSADDVTEIGDGVRVAIAKA